MKKGTRMSNLVQRAIHDETSGPGFATRIISVLAAMGVSSWSDAAAFFGTAYTLVLLTHYLWKHFVRPFCERRGWIERRTNRRASDREAS